jgi:CheY-like chemotaxis protein
MNKSIHILLVEDNEGDIILTKEAFEEKKIVNKISVAKDGKQATDLLKSLAASGKNELPNLILLDINLPKKNGHEVLYEIKNNDQLKHIPVIILTTSSSIQDVKLAYKNHANCYITKPVDLNEFMNAIATIESFWFEIVMLSPNN